MSRHRRILAWQKARDLVRLTYRACVADNAPSRRVLHDQLRRAVLSVQLNLAEGQASGPGKRCRYLTRVAYGSAVEATEILRLLGELTPRFSPLVPLSHEVQALTMLLLKSMK